MCVITVLFASGKAIVTLVLELSVFPQKYTNLRGSLSRNGRYLHRVLRASVRSRPLCAQCAAVKRKKKASGVWAGSTRPVWEITLRAWTLPCHGGTAAVGFGLIASDAAFETEHSRNCAFSFPRQKAFRDTHRALCTFKSQTAVGSPSVHNESTLLTIIKCDVEHAHDMRGAGKSEPWISSPAMPSGWQSSVPGK